MDNGEASDPGVGLEPEAVEKTDFATVRRGFEPGPVRTRLREAAEEIRRLNALVDSLSKRIAELEATPAEVLESRRVAEALGDEATRILQSASDAAQERLEHAEAEHARILREAETAAAATIEEGREQGRNMLLEARNIRERILADLAGKRHDYQVEVEQLREMHDRLLEALGIFQQGLDGWIEELVQSGPRAAAAAERAGLRVAAQPEPTVAQIEAEIGTARLAGIPLDGRTGEGAPGRDKPPAPDDVFSGEDAESESPEGKDESEGMVEPEGGDEPVEVTEATLEPGPESSGARARLYDMEAETEVDFADVGHVLQGAASDTADDAAGAAGREVGTGSEAAPASDAEAIFARLRSITTQPVSAAPKPSPTAAGAPDDTPGTLDDAPGTLGDETTSPPTGVAEGPVEFADEFDDEFSDEHEAAVQLSDPDDLVSAARAVAVGAIARRLKRLTVDEQGDLLDGIRRNGVRALRSTIAEDTKAYTRAARVPMQDFASDIDVSIDDIDLAAAGAAILSVLVEPVRSRLSELAEETNDADELSSVVRAIYRESRSRRADSAAEAAFSAGWSEPVS